MSNLKLNYWINIGLMISFTICFITGLIKWPGIIKIIGTSAYNILRFNNISLFHDWSGLIMSMLVLFHLVLNWKWMVSVTKSFSKKK
ncbi:DUF4405 domain-containing protein [Candidatus Pacearchaeota archaeon]|nr:DUF4405 domain-containing protein [Candidatus Pacearchaeota archaeon]